MIPFLYLQVLNWVMQLGCLGEHVLMLLNVVTRAQVALGMLLRLAGYGTYVVASMRPSYGCWASNHRRNLTRILVYVSWAMIIIFDW